MKTIKLLSVLLAVSLPTMAQENYEQEFTEEAPISFIESVLETCKIYAEEDGVTPDEMTTYLLECVNDDMEMSGYKHLTKLPTETTE